MTSVELHSATPSQTRRVGERIGRMLEAGDVVLLSGELGAGKTVLAQGIAKGLGVTDPVKSSSFVIMNEYEGQALRLYHADLYRLEDPAQVAELALDELAAGGVLVVEWPEQAGGELAQQHLLVRLSYEGAKGRGIVVEGVGARYAGMVQRLRGRGADALRGDLVWRAPTIADIPAISELAARSDAESGALDATLVGELASRLEWDGGIHNVSRVVEDGGLNVAAGWVRTMGSRACIYGFAKDERLYADVIHWLDGVAPRCVYDGGWIRIERVVAPATPDVPARDIALYESLGYERFYVELEMQLALVGTTEAEAGGLSLTPWTVELHPLIREAYNDAFKARGFEGYAEDDWERAFGPDDFRPELSFMAIAGEEVVGFVFCGVLDVLDDWVDPAIRGAGWIDSIGVRSSHQGRGVAPALLRRVMEAMRAAGRDRVVLRVSEDNARARVVYERLGFQTTRKHVVYRKPRGT